MALGTAGLCGEADRREAERMLAFPRLEETKLTS